MGTSGLSGIEGSMRDVRLRGERERRERSERLRGERERREKGGR